MQRLSWRRWQFFTASTLAGVASGALLATGSNPFQQDVPFAAHALFYVGLVFAAACLYLGVRGWNASDAYRKPVMPTPRSLLAVGALLGTLGVGFAIGRYEGPSAPTVTAHSIASAPPSPSYAAALSRALHALGRARARAHRRLRSAKTPSGQADAARSARHAFVVTTTSLRHLPAPAGDKDAHRALIAALEATGKAYEALRAAAEAGDAIAFKRAETRVSSATDKLRAARARFGALGYDVAA